MHYALTLTTIMYYSGLLVLLLQTNSPTAAVLPKIQQTMILVTYQRFDDLLLFGLIWEYSSVQTKYDRGRLKVMATYLQQ